MRSRSISLYVSSLVVVIAIGASAYCQTNFPFKKKEDKLSFISISGEGAAQFLKGHNKDDAVSAANAGLLFRIRPEKSKYFFFIFGINQGARDKKTDVVEFNQKDLLFADRGGAAAILGMNWDFYEAKSHIFISPNKFYWEISYQRTTIFGFDSADPTLESAFESFNQDIGFQWEWLDFDKNEEPLSFVLSASFHSFNVVDNSAENFKTLLKSGSSRDLYYGVGGKAVITINDFFLAAEYRYYPMKEGGDPELQNSFIQFGVGVLGSIIDL